MEIQLSHGAMDLTIQSLANIFKAQQKFFFNYMGGVCGDLSHEMSASYGIHCDLGQKKKI